MLSGDEICARKSHESPIHRRRDVPNFLFPYELVTTGVTLLAASDVVYRHRPPAKTPRGPVLTEKNSRERGSNRLLYGRVGNFAIDAEPRKCIHGHTPQTSVTCSRPSKYRVRKTRLTGRRGRRGMIAFDASNKVTLHASRRGNPFLQLARVWISSPPSSPPRTSLREGGNRATV